MMCRASFHVLTCYLCYPSIPLVKYLFISFACFLNCIVFLFLSFGNFLYILNRSLFQIHDLQIYFSPVCGLPFPAPNNVSYEEVFNFDEVQFISVFLWIVRLVSI